MTDGNGVLMGEEGWNVVDLYETDEYYQMLELARKWYNAGYIKSDAATDKESEASYMSAGRLFASVSYSESASMPNIKLQPVMIILVSR